MIWRCGKPTIDDINMYIYIYPLFVINMSYLTIYTQFIQFLNNIYLVMVLVFRLVSMTLFHPSWLDDPKWDHWAKPPCPCFTDIKCQGIRLVKPYVSWFNWWSIPSYQSPKSDNIDNIDNIPIHEHCQYQLVINSPYCTFWLHKYDHKDAVEVVGGQCASTCCPYWWYEVCDLVCIVHLQVL